MKSLIFALTTWIIFLMTGVFMLVSCTSKTATPVLLFTDDSGDSIHTSPSPTAKENITIYLPSLTNTSSPNPPVMEVDIPTKTLPQAIQLAKSDLAEILGIESEDILIIKSFRTQFSASDLSCHPDEVEPKSEGTVIPGLVVVLHYGGTNYTYHATGSLAELCSQKP